MSDRSRVAMTGQWDNLSRLCAFPLGLLIHVNAWKNDMAYPMLLLSHLVL